MMSKNFKVGQVWATRSGIHMEIINVYIGTERKYPVVAKHINGDYLTYNENGVYDIAYPDSTENLTYLVSDVKEQPTTKKHKWYDVIVAYAEGKEIQYSHIDDGVKWFSHSQNNPLQFDNKTLQWRIKPETKVLKYRIALLNFNGEFCVNAVNDWVNYNTVDIDGFVRWLDDEKEIEV